MATVIELTDKIEELFIKIPDKRKKIEYTEWRDTINKVIQDCNKLCKFKMYDIIKK
jgi:hypothetical protein